MRIAPCSASLQAHVCDPQARADCRPGGRAGRSRLQVLAWPHNCRMPFLGLPCNHCNQFQWRSPPAKLTPSASCPLPSPPPAFAAERPPVHRRHRQGRDPGRLSRRRGYAGGVQGRWGFKRQGQHRGAGVQGAHRGPHHQPPGAEMWGWMGWIVEGGGETAAAGLAHNQSCWAAAGTAAVPWGAALGGRSS